MHGRVSVPESAVSVAETSGIGMRTRNKARPQHIAAGSAALPRPCGACPM